MSGNTKVDAVLEPEASFMLVDAETASKWLERNKINRPVRQRLVEAYARDMVAGRWHKNGESIKFTIEGDLGDGQHRLLAVVLAAQTDPDITIEFLVVENITPESVLTIDAGAVRTWRDFKAMHGTQAAGAISAIIRRIVNWDAGLRLPTGGSRIALTNSEIEEFYEKNPERLTLAVRAANRVYGQHRLSPTAVGAAFFLFHRLGPETTDKFFDDLVNWTQNCPPGHPLLALVQAFNNRRTDGTLTPDIVLCLLIMAWNAVLAGDQGRTKYQLPRGGLTNASFPAPDKPRHE